LHTHTHTHTHLRTTCARVSVCVCVCVCVLGIVGFHCIHTHTQKHTLVRMCGYVYAADIGGIVHCVCVCACVCVKCMPQTSAASSPGLLFDTRSCENVFLCVGGGGQTRYAKFNSPRGPTIAWLCHSPGGGAVKLLSRESERERGRQTDRQTDRQTHPPAEGRRSCQCYFTHTHTHTHTHTPAEGQRSCPCLSRKWVLEQRICSASF
jgi:hypothetical protein